MDTPSQKSDYTIKRVKDRYVVRYRPAGARQGREIGVMHSQTAAEAMVEAAVAAPLGTVQREGCEIAVGDVIHLGRKVRVLCIETVEGRLRYDLWPEDGRQEPLIGGAHPYGLVTVYPPA